MAMSAADLQKQLSQMVAFIEQEAKEKAEEIYLKAQEEYTLEKNRLIAEQRNKIFDQYKNKSAQNEMLQKISHSQLQNQARMLVLKDRESLMLKVLETTSKKLVKIAQDKDRYKKILEGLITQGLFQLIEDVVVVYCRKVDVDLVKSVVPDCIKNYERITHKKVKVTVDDGTHLKATSTGGVELVAHQGKIKVDNLIQSRLEMLYVQRAWGSCGVNVELSSSQAYVTAKQVGKQMLPELRDIVFGPNVNRKFFD